MLEKVLQPAGADDLAEQLRTYIEATLHQPVQLSQWKDATGLPAFLSHRYDFFAGSISHQPCLFAVDRDSASVTPKEVARHLVQVERAFDGTVIYAAQRLSADRRARLIANGVPFIIPRNQLYIPQLALDLREYFHARPRPRSEQLSPAAQAVLFHHLLSPLQAAKALHDSYSAMSIGRAYKELAQFGLVEVTKHGRANKIEFMAESRHLIDLARPYLRNPVRSQKNIGAGLIPPHISQAGESALSTLTDLSPPTLPVYAVHYKEWSNTVANAALTLVEHVDEAVSVIELWHYDPMILADAGVVDRLSLWTQFRNHPDERVAKAAEDLLEQVSW